MPSPFEDGEQTKTIDIPEIQPEPPREQSSVPWMIVGVVSLILLALLVLSVVALSG
ncbi:MAG TPA: hypothetical protein VK923_00745 [Euzebyales bacterium]|nr:hypothetical protein [Euzebyales bacterium]